jgi:glycosyltransferase involved in cell wall biosynthesis
MARCAVYAQLPQHEGLPNTLIQAMYMGAPSISTDCQCGPAEIITQPGVDGFLVPIGDAHAAAERIRLLLDDPSLAQRMGDCGRQSAQRFSAERIFRRYTTALSGEIEKGLATSG